MYSEFQDKIPFFNLWSLIQVHDSRISFKLCQNTEIKFLITRKKPCFCYKQHISNSVKGKSLSYEDHKQSKIHCVFKILSHQGGRYNNILLSGYLLYYNMFPSTQLILMQHVSTCGSHHQGDLRNF